MKITFEGFYGFKNAGDDAFIEVSAWGSRKYWDCKKNVFIGSSLPTVIHPIITSQWPSKLKGGDRLDFTRHLNNSNYFISAGGSTFANLPSHSNKKIAYTMSAYRKNLKLGAVGVSLGPFTSIKAEKDVKKYLERLSFLALRDRRSYEYALSLDLNYKPVNAFDLAALLPLVYKDIPNKTLSNSNSPTVGISICNYERYKGGDILKEQKRNQFFKQVVDLLLSTSAVHLKVFIIHGNAKVGDKQATLQLLKGVDKSRFTIVPYLNDVKKTWDEIGTCDLIISTRLHASIFAAYNNVPFFLIEYHKKCSDFLNDIGQDDQYRIYDAEIEASALVETIHSVLNGEYNPPKYVAETIGRAEMNFTETLPKIGY